MLVEEVKQLDTFDRFKYWITERESIRVKREQGEEKPWTSNEVFQKYKFCNVRRMDDRVSKWLLENWYTPYYGHKNMLTAVSIARHFNRIECLESFGFPQHWNPARISSILTKRSELGLRNFSGAYMITGKRDLFKHDYVLYDVVNQIHDLRSDINVDSMQLTCEALQQVKGLGSFLSGQIVCDMRWATHGSWKDRLTWAPIGPGSKRGMNRLKDRDLNASLDQAKFLPELLEMIARLKEELPSEIYVRLEAIDFQNCLCEFDKMERTLWEGRRPKQLYPGI